MASSSKDSEMTLAERKQLQAELGEYVAHLPEGVDRWSVLGNAVSSNKKVLSALLKQMADAKLPISEFYNIGGKHLTVNEQIALQLLMMAGRGNLAAIQEYAKQVQQDGEIALNVTTKTALDASQLAILAELGVDLGFAMQIDSNVTVIESEAIEEVDDSSWLD